MTDRHLRRRIPMLLARLILVFALLAGGASLISDAALAQSAGSAAEAGTPIRITVGSTVLSGHLNSTTMAQRLAERLPMTATFGDHPNGGDFATKVTHLDPPLLTEGTKLGAAPGPGDIALYVPSGNFGFYYGQLQHWGGAVVLGNFEGDPKLFEQQSGPFTVSIEAVAD